MKPLTLFDFVKDGNTQFFKRLLETRVDEKLLAELNTLDENQDNVLLSAIRYNRPEIVEMLIQIPGIHFSTGQEIRIDAPPYDFAPNKTRKSNALIMAILFNRVDIFKKLLTVEGIDLNTKEFQGLTPYMIAVAEGRNDIASAIREFADKQEKNLMPPLYKVDLTPPVDQVTVFEKIKIFLKLQSKKDPNKYKELSSFFSNLELGKCSGFTILWLYRKRFDEDEQFFSMTRVITGWDETEKSLAEGENFLHHIFETFMNDILFAQQRGSSHSVHIFNQADAANIIETIRTASSHTKRAGSSIEAEQEHKISQEKQSLFRNEFNFSYIVDRKELKILLDTLFIPKDPLEHPNPKENKLIYIAVGDHALGVTLIQGKYHFYSSSTFGGEEVLDSIEEVQERIEHNDKNLRPDSNLTRIPIEVNVFDLSSQDPAFQPDAGIKLMSQFIKENNDVNREFLHYQSALFWAIFSDNNDAVCLLLKDKSVDINKKYKGTHPLLYSIKENGAVFKSILALRGKEISEEILTGALNIIFITMRDYNSDKTVFISEFYNPSYGLKLPWTDQDILLKAMKYENLPIFKTVLELRKDFLSPELIDLCLLAAKRRGLSEFEKTLVEFKDKKEKAEAEVRAEVTAEKKAKSMQDAPEESPPPPSKYTP